MATRFVFSSQRIGFGGTGLKPSKSSITSAGLMSSLAHSAPPYNTLVFQAVRLLGPPATFEDSKLKVVFKGIENNNYAKIVPRSYYLSHCDFTANLTLTISNIISLDQLKGWYNKDDVVAQWTKVKGDVYLDVHCFVSGPYYLADLAAEIRYHIFSKELPLVLKAVISGDRVLFSEHLELMDALVRVYFHSSSNKYNRMECWGALKDAAQGRMADHMDGMLFPRKTESFASKELRVPKSLFQTLLTFLL